MSHGAALHPSWVLGPRVRVRASARVVVLVACSCAALWTAAGAVDASGAIECGTTKVVGGHALRVQILRGNVSCRLAREVIRHHVAARFTPGDLPPAPEAWNCSTSRTWIVTCTQGRTRTVRGLPR